MISQIFNMSTSQLIHKSISIFINLLSLSFKIPQIYTMLNKKTSKGISPLSNYLDFYSILFQGLYGYHKGLSILIYLENFSSSIQNIIIIFLSWYYSNEKSSNKSILLKFLFCVTTPLIIFLSVYDKGNLIPDFLWNVLVLFGMPFMAMSRIAQMRKIYVEKSVGAVSLMSFILRAMKNFIKIFVIMYEKFNWQLILNQLWLGIFTVGVIGFILKYRNYNKKDKSN